MRARSEYDDSLGTYSQSASPRFSARSLYQIAGVISATSRDLMCFPIVERVEGWTPRTVESKETTDSGICRCPADHSLKIAGLIPSKFAQFEGFSPVFSMIFWSIRPPFKIAPFSRL